jgi:hypothetical protein
MLTSEEIVTTRILLTLPVALCIASPLHAVEGFYLDAELRTTFGHSSSTHIFTEHTYDSDGLRTTSIVHNGPDAGGPEMSRTAFTYTSDGSVSTEYVLQGNDTLSIVEHSYDGAGREIAVAVLGGDGTLRFVDSLDYDSQDRPVRCSRYVEGVMTFYHAYGYDDTGNRLADTLYEYSGETAVASQVWQFSHNSDNQVLSERHLRRSGDGWYLAGTVIMAYVDGFLGSATEYEGDGSSNRMLDSLAYTYDEHGNRLSEERFDDERVRKHLIEYTWRADATAATTPASTAEGISLAIRKGSGGLWIHTAKPIPVSVKLFDMSGRLVAAGKTGGASTLRLDLDRTISRGRYVARVLTENRVTTVAVSL